MSNFDFQDEPEPPRKYSRKQPSDFGRAFKWGAGIWLGIIIAGLIIPAAMFLFCCGGLAMVGVGAKAVQATSAKR